MTPLPDHTAAQPATIGAAYARAVELINAGQLDEAQNVCMRILAVRPKQPDVHKLLGAIAHQARDGDAAITHFKHALKLDSDDLETRQNLAKIYRDFGRWQDAAVAFEALVKRTPADSTALYGLAKAYDQLGRHGEAARSYERALAGTAAPDVVETELASALLRAGDLAGAERHHVAVLDRTPHFVPALLNLAILRDEQGRMDEALTILERAVAANPDNAEAHFHHALAQIARGTLANGWAEYVWRFQRPKAATLHDRFPMPYWAGEPLEGRTLLVWTEQGLGDEILLCGMIPDVLERGARVILVCTQRLASLLQKAFPSVTVVVRETMNSDATPVAADYQASLSHLGLYLRPSFAAFPKRGAYLKADYAQATALKQKYRGDSHDRVIGIAWHSANVQASAEKSIALTAWENILRTPGCRFVSLQYGDHKDAHRALHKATGLKLIVDDTIDARGDLTAFAAQVAAMDLVVSVSNTTVHVAGALGVPVWTLLPASTGRIWYWFLDRTDSPWYPSMRLFRQQRGSGWTPVLEAVARELRT